MQQDKQMVLQTQMVKLTDIKPCKWNPPSRTKEENLSGLIDSIEQFYVPLPIILTHELESLEGNRRVKSFERLGKTHIPAIILPKDFPQEQIYSLLTTNIRKHTPNEKMYVWLKEPRAVPLRFHQRMIEIEKKIGRPLVEKLCNAGLSIRTYSVARRIAAYCKDETADFVKKTVKWLINYRGTGIIGRANWLMSEDRNNADILMKAILTNTDLE